MAIRTAPKRPITLDEFLDMPETEPASELIDGEVVQKPMAKVPHSRAQSRLQRLLILHPATTDGESLTELTHPVPRADRPNARVPDLSYYLPGHEIESDSREYPVNMPDLAVEVRSPGQALRLLRDKLTFLRDQGVPATLLIDPSTRTVEVHDGAATSTHGAGETVTLAVLRGFSFEVDALFDRQR